MRITVTANSITQPTYQTLEEYSTKRLKKISKLLPKSDQTDHEIRVRGEKSGDMFEVMMELFVPTHFVSKCKDRDMRKAVDECVEALQRQLRDHHDKVVA